MKRVLVTGSREWSDVASVHSALDKVIMRVGRNLTLVHGGARGVDTMASDWAQMRGVAEEIHYADWNRLGKSAGHIRNFGMVKRGADICLAFIENESSGASGCAKLAEDNGIPTFRHIRTTN